MYKHHHDLKEDQCPHCGHTFDCASSERKEQVPEPGDVSVCLYCTGFMIFNEEMKLRVLTAEEIAEMPAEKRSDLIQLRKHLEFLNAKRQEQQG